MLIISFFVLFQINDIVLDKIFFGGGQLPQLINSNFVETLHIIM